MLFRRPFRPCRRRPLPSTAQGAGSRPAQVDRLAPRLRPPPGLKLREIQRLADTANPRAADALVPLLSDPAPENRAAAAEALGKLGRPADVTTLRPLLQDPHGPLPPAPPGALYRHSATRVAHIFIDIISPANTFPRLTPPPHPSPRPETPKRLL